MVQFYNPTPNIDWSQAKKYGKKAIDNWQVDDKQEYIEHVMIGAAFGGMPHAFELFDAIYDRDYERAIRAIQVEIGVFATYYAMTHLANMVQGPKYYFNPRHAMHAASRMRGYMISGVLKNPITIATGVAVAGAIGYEKAVNEPLRQAHGGIDLDWFGPFASGFGTVV